MPELVMAAPALAFPRPHDDERPHDDDMPLIVGMPVQTSPCSGGLLDR
jgi:hypothetical protein